MAQSLGVQEIQQRRDRSRVGLGPVVTLVAVTVAALFLAPAIWAGNTPAVRPAPNPVPRVAPATPQVAPFSYGQWASSAESAGFTGRLGAAAPQSGSTYGEWLASDGRALAAAKAAGFTGRLGGSAAATTAGSVNFTDKLKAGRA